VHCWIWCLALLEEGPLGDSGIRDMHSTGRLEDSALLNAVAY
jgi:hypothetical protein